MFISDDEEEEASFDARTSTAPPLPVKAEAAFVVEDKTNAICDFKRCFKNWVKYHVPWAVLFPGLASFDLLDDLMHLDVGVVYLHIQRKPGPQQIWIHFVAGELW